MNLSMKKLFIHLADYVIDGLPEDCTDKERMAKAEDIKEYLMFVWEKEREKK